MISLALTDGTGRVWDLTDPGAELVLARGVRGLDDADLEPLVHDVRDGRRWDGWRASERQVTLPLFASSPDLPGLLREFKAGTRPLLPGHAGPGACVLTAVMPDATSWQIGVRRISSGVDMDRDPTEVGGVRMESVWDGDVFWAGPVWSSTWQAVAGSGSWLLTSGGVARLSPGHTLANASTVNAGDMPVWPTWTITGPCSWASVGVGDRQVTLDATLAAGESVTIDTDPEQGQMAVKSDGTDMTDRLSAVDFAQIEPGANALVVTMTGTGTIGVSYRPLRLSVL